MNVWGIIDQHLRNPMVSMERESTSLHCSAAGISFMIDGRNVRKGGCRRKEYFRFKRYPPDERGIDLSGFTKMTFGNFAEGIVAEYTKIGGIYMATQVPMTLKRKTPSGVEYRINGFMDFLLRDPQTGRPEIAEMKTTGVFGEPGVITPTKDKPLCPKPEHVLQCVPYLDWLILHGVPIQFAKANLLYLSRDGNHAQHVLMLDPSTRGIIIQNDVGMLKWDHITPEKVYADFDGLAEAIFSGTVPARDYELQWSRESILWKYEHGDLKKTSMDKVKSKLNAGDQGVLLEEGDFECGWCEFQQGCWNPSPGFIPDTDEPRQIVPTTQQPGSLASHAPVALAPLPGS